MMRSGGVCHVPEFQSCPTERGHPGMTIALETILEPAVLRRVWKDVRKRERGIHLTQIPLVRDSTGGIAFELSLSDVLENLRLRLLEGTYRPHAAIIIEAAKSKLLHRRLSFLTFEDGLILGCLVQAARAALIQKMPAWVSFGQLDKPKKKSNEPGSITVDYEGWWTKWLRYRRLLKVIEGDPNPLLVVSDITNFFASIDLSLLRSKVSGETLLDEKAINLLFYLLENLRPADGYSPSGSLGLPTVADDTSRILAHFYLTELDDELVEEGQSGRYTRWVDDMVISVPDAVEGGKVVTRIERALSRVGLVANSSKTDLVSKAVFRESHHEEENEYLDEVHQAIETKEEFTSEDLLLFEERLTSFLCSPKEGNWSRILRRYYTESRRVRSTILLTQWKDHLAVYPTNSQNILDYVSFFPGDMEFCDQLFGYLEKQGPLHEDIQILLYETLLLKPFPNDFALRDHMVGQVSSHLLGNDGFEAPVGYIKGLQALTMYKFGGIRASEILGPMFAKAVLDSPIFATYGLPVLAASKCHRQLAFEATEQMEDSRILRIRALIERLENGDDKAIGVLLGLLQPKMTKYPTRWVTNSRALPFLRIALCSTNTKNHKLLSEANVRFIARLSSMGDTNLVDWVTLEHLGSVSVSSASTVTS